MTKHPLNRARFGESDNDIIRPLRLVYPDDSDVTAEERSISNGLETLRRKNAMVWWKRNVPLFWRRPGFEMDLVRGIRYRAPMNNSNTAGPDNELGRAPQFQNIDGPSATEVANISTLPEPNLSENVEHQRSEVAGIYELEEVPYAEQQDVNEALEPRPRINNQTSTRKRSRTSRSFQNSE